MAQGLILVADSSAWIAAYLPEMTSTKDQMLDAIQNHVILVPDLVLVEVLRGIGIEKKAKEVAKEFDNFQTVQVGGKLMAVHAASNFRALRGKGITIRGTVDLLIEKPPQARRVEAEPIGLGPGIRVQMELPEGVKIDMTIETGYAQAGLDRFTVVRRVEFFLRELRHQQAEPVQLHRGDQPSKQPIKVLGVHDLTLGHIAQFGMRRQKDGRWELGKKTLGQIELHIETFQARELLNLYSGKDHPPHLMFDMR